MRVRLFGKNSDDKGTQLEKLTRYLLERLGYRQITLNFAAAGGSEIDIKADYPLPGLAGVSLVPLIGECKAYEAPVRMTDWLKFLGKLYTKRSCGRKDLRGLFVALSGVNGHVSGAYDDLRAHDQTVDLITGDNLITQMLDGFDLPSASDVISQIGRLTSDPVAATSLGYYEGVAFWIAEFANSTFTIVWRDLLNQNLKQELVDLVSGQIEAATYRDLAIEQLAKDRLVLAKKHVLGQLLTDQLLDAPPAQDLVMAGLPIIDADDIEHACTELISEGKIVQNGTAVKLADMTDVCVRASVIRDMVSGIVNLNHIASDAWESLIDDELLDESLRIKDELEMQPVDRAGLVQMMKWSPEGLLWALTPDELLCGHRREAPEVQEVMTRTHVRYYRAQLLSFAIQAFRTAGHSGIMHQRYGLRELEFVRRGVFKSQKGVELDLEVTERTALAHVGTTSGPIGHVYLVEHAPQPWSLYASSSDPAA